VKPEAARAHAIFTKALSLDSAEREAMVVDACAGDAEVLKRVRRLLSMADRSAGFLDTPALARHETPIPDAVGTYLVVGVLGVGGMATVYEAMQESPKRRVAVKVMHQSMTHTDAVLRFRLETQTLARLVHPGIARIYEAGTAQFGQFGPTPFFAMELVPDALSITAYARKHNLALEDRLKMFAAVCDAVTFGHQNGIIHRDLKPANVLVGSDGIAKVIDFGIARSTHADAPSLTRTADAAKLIGTLNYMSPEQCDARANIDIRVDVYSLGVLLYELVSGHLPYDLSNLTIPAAVQRITHDPPRRPDLPRSHPYGDLWAIVFKTLEKQRNRRYASVAGLAADVRRLLSFQPIEARPPGFAHQFRLFAKRHRTFVTAGLALSMGIVILAAASTGFAVRLSREVHQREVAERQVTRERDTARWQAYVAQMSGALSAMKADEFQQLRTRLAAVTFQPRGWEWGFLSRLAERSASTIEAHDGMIQDFAANRDQTRFVTAADRGSVRLWDESFRRPLASFESDTRARMLAAAFTSDGQSVVCGDALGAVRLLDRDSLQERSVLTQMAGAVRAVAGLPNRRVAVADEDGSCRILDIDSTRADPLSDDQPGGVHGLCVSPDGAWLATSNLQGVLWLRDAATGMPVHKLVFGGGINMVRFSGDSTVVAATGEGGRVLVWNTSTGVLSREIQATQGINTVQSLAISNDGSMLAAGLVHRDIVVYSLLDGRTIGKLGGHTDAVSGVLFRSGDTRLTSTSWDRTIRDWRTDEIASPTGVTTLAGHRGWVRAIAMSPDGSTIVSASQDGDLRFWNPDLRQSFARISVGHGTLFAVDYSPDGRLIAVACADRTVQLRDSCSGTIVREWTETQHRVASLAFNPTSERLVVGKEDGSVGVRDLKSGEETQVMLGHRERVNSVRFSPEGSVIASASRDGDVRLWNASTGVELHRLADHGIDVFAVLFSHDGRRIFSGSRDQSVIVWDVNSGSKVATLKGHGQNVTCLALSPNATRLAAGSWFGEIVLFDVNTFDQIASFRGHDAAIRGIRFSPDGRWLVSCSYDSTVRLFDSATREQAAAASTRATNSFADARRLVQSVQNKAPPDSAALFRGLLGLGIDPASDHWVRSAILSNLAPPDDQR
jgi:eukaryotic-like serine/threonine-protein kinase